MPTRVRQPPVPRFRGLSRTGASQKHRHSVKTDSSPQCRSATDSGLSSQLLQRHSTARRNRTVSRPEPETVSLSHYYRRHHHRARNHSRAMRQVAEWIENANIVNTGPADKAAVVPRRNRTHQHVHEHHHHHYHYHYSASGMV